MIKWKALRKFHSYNQKKKQCVLCLNEKCEIACYKGDNLLYKRTEFLGICRYRNKYKLKNCNSKADVINQSHNLIKDPLH